jgi:hypothetical protein
MTYPDVLAALARERSGTFLAEAKTARQARQARRYRQANRAAGTRTTRLHRLPPWLRPGLSRRPGRSPSSAAAGTPAGLGTVEYEVALVLPAGDRGHDQAPQSVSQR